MAIVPAKAGRATICPPPPPPLLLFVSNAKDGKTIWIEISVNDAIKNLKRLVSRKMEIPIDQQVLVFKGEELKNTYLVGDCKLPQESTVHVLNLLDMPELEK